MKTSEPNLSPGTREASKVCGEVEQKKCSNCGREFPCGAATRLATGDSGFSCWCEELPHVALEPTADQDCLCRECLTAAIEKRTHVQSDNG